MLFKKRSVLAAVMAVTMLMGACTTTGDANKPAAPAPAAPAAEAPATTGDAAPAPASTEPKILHVNNHEEPGSLHPALAQGTHESWPIDHMFEGLFTKTASGYENGLCESYETSSDGLTWTFHLAKDGKWSTGNPVVAKDFEVAWKYCLDPANASDYASYLYFLKGATEYNAATENAAALADGVGVKAVDDYTLEVQLAGPLPFLPEVLTHYTCFPVDHLNQEKYPEWALSSANYSANGPFVLTRWENKVGLTTTKNPNYRKASEVKLDEIDWAMDAEMSTEWQKYQEGELDLSYPLLPAVIEQLQANNDPELLIEPDLSVYYYLFNTKKKPFNNVKVRKALAQTINREAIVKSVTKGGQSPAYGITPPGIADITGDYQKNLGPLFAEDAAGAKALLEEGLKEEGMTVADFKFTILLNPSEIHKKVAEAIQAMWRQNLGVECTLETTEFAVMLERRHAGDFDVARAGWIGDFADPVNFLDMWMTGHSINDSQWGDPAYDALIKTAQNSSDPAVRMEALKKAETMLVKDLQIMSPIYFYTKPMAIKPYVKGVYTPVNRYPQFEKVDIVK